jgi:hypothetical protein
MPISPVTYLTIKKIMYCNYNVAFLIFVIIYFYLEPNSSSTDSNSIFAQVNKIAEGAPTDGSSGSSLEITAVKANVEDSEDTFPIDGSDDPSAGTSNKNDSRVSIITFLLCCAVIGTGIKNKQFDNST